MVDREAAAALATVEEFAKANGQILLPLVELVTQARVAVEEVIDEHYQAQAATLGEEDPAFRETILSFRDDEIAHRDLAIAQGAEESPGYDLISAVVKTGSRVAIWLSTRL